MGPASPRSLTCLKFRFVPWGLSSSGTENLHKAVIIAQKSYSEQSASLATPGIPPHVPRFRAQMAARDVNVGFTPTGRMIVAAAGCGVTRLAARLRRTRAPAVLSDG
jgi:hypothetical protein